MGCSPAGLIGFLSEQVVLRWISTNLDVVFQPYHGHLLLQTSIITEGFRSLAEGEPVEFYVESGDDGRTKAVQVTGPAGAPPQVRLSNCVDIAGTLSICCERQLISLVYSVAG